MNSSKPIIVCGAGVQMTSKRQVLIDKLFQWGIPTALTWGAKDLLPSDSEFLLGTFGTHGERHVNIALNQADLIVSIGSRLDLKATGTPVSTFAPTADKIMIDVDESEISKFDESGLDITVSMIVDIESDEFDSLLRDFKFDESKVADWKESLIKFKGEFPEENRCFPGEGINPYEFIKVLGDSVLEPVNLIVDTGCAIAWTMQVWKTKSNQRIFHDFNNTAMGWSIPATIASALASPGKTHICVVGDGSIMMALNDLPTLSSLPAITKIVILNNFGYAMIKQTQDQWFKGEYFASNSDTALNFPNFSKVADAMGFVYFSVDSDSEVKETLRQVLNDDRPLILEVFIQESARVVPIVKFGNANHVMEPNLADSNK
jgi:acetolactate synthase-1/2/3 large subunit